MRAAASVTAALERVLPSASAAPLSHARSQSSHGPRGPPGDQALVAPAGPPRTCCRRGSSQAESAPQPPQGAMCNGDDCTARCVPEASLQSILASNRCGVCRTPIWGQRGGGSPEVAAACVRPLVAAAVPRPVPTLGTPAASLLQALGQFADAA